MDNKNLVEITKEDALRTFYFIVAKTQDQKNGSMQGALSSKGDLIGGIFDRWINTVTESVIFNKAVFPLIKFDDESIKAEVIPDYYLYNPKSAGIAPDVIGIRAKEKAIPFAVYDEKWKPVENMPQIEVKTYKKNQKMISLRDQDYSSKYLVMTETDLRIDYLLPFFDKSNFDKSIYEQMTMDDETFLKNRNDKIKKIPSIDVSDSSLGLVSLLGIVSADDFMKYSNLCRGGESPMYISEISEARLTGRPIEEELTDKLRNDILEGNLTGRVPVDCPLTLSYYGSLNDNKFFEFNERWNKKIENITKTKNGKLNIKTLNFWSDCIDGIQIKKFNKKNIYIVSENDTNINGTVISKGKTYKLDFEVLDRTSNKGEEYFFSKSIVEHIPSQKTELMKKLKTIIENNI